MPEKIKLTAIRDTWSDSRVTVYQSPNQNLYIEFAMINDDNQLVGCFPQLVPYSEERVHKGQYVALRDKKTPLIHPQVEVDLNDRPRVASDWMLLHTINTLHKRTERPPEELRLLIK